MKKFKKGLTNLIAILFWIAVWQVAATAVANSLLLPGPAVVASRLSSLGLTAGFWETVGLSLFRICFGILVAIVLGVILAVLCCRFRWADALFAPLVAIVKSTPVASFIMLALLWLNRDILPIFIAVLIALPVVFANVSGGIRRFDRGLLEVAQVYRLPLLCRLKRFWLPGVYPDFMAACRSCLGLAWKAGIAAEVLAVPAVSIGRMIYESKIYLETTELFVWSITVILLSVLIEKIFCSGLERLGKKYERQG